jgi:hypothetical protein
MFGSNILDQQNITLTLLVSEFNPLHTTLKYLQVPQRDVMMELLASLLPDVEPVLITGGLEGGSKKYFQP